MEFADGRNTGRSIRALVTYMLEEYTGLTEGYCVMGIKVVPEAVSYTHLDVYKRQQLKRLGNWQCTDKCKRGSGKPHFMHSRLIYGRDEGKGKKC